MKKYFREFTPVSNSLTTRENEELEELICLRQENFRNTANYQEEKGKVLSTLREIQRLLPEHSETFGDIEDSIFWVETICYSAAYKDGMSDLMAAMTFNKIGITKVEYLGCKGA